MERPREHFVLCMYSHCPVNACDRNGKMVSSRMTEQTLYLHPRAVYQMNMAHVCASQSLNNYRVPSPGEADMCISLRPLSLVSRD